MKAFFRAFIITLIATLIPFLTFVAVIYADEVTRKIGYDDPSPAFDIDGGGIVLFGKKYMPIWENKTVKKTGSFLTSPQIKLGNMVIQRIAELISHLLP